MWAWYIKLVVPRRVSAVASYEEENHAAAAYFSRMYVGAKLARRMVKVGAVMTT
jgi:hypothetical protein